MWKYLFNNQGNIDWWFIAVFICIVPIIRWIITVAYEFIKQVVPPSDILSRYCRKDVQSWAVVTGATDGIGLGFCQVLVDQGFNVVLISRNPQKLKKTIQALTQRSKQNKKEVKLKSITFNFKDSSDPIKYPALLEQLKNLDIGIFINNVGTSDIKFFHKHSREEIVDIININCTGMALLSADMLGIMSTRKHKSALINLSSYMEQIPLPYLALYSASKGFNKNLTQSLCYQYPEIDVMCLKPLFVETPLSRQKKGFTVPDRRQCARDSLRELRWQKQTYGHISHRILGSVTKYLVPKKLCDFVLNRFGPKFVRKTFKLE